MSEQKKQETAEKKGKGVQFDPGGTWFYTAANGTKIAGVYVTGDPHGTGQSQETFYLTPNYQWPGPQGGSVYFVWDQGVTSPADMLQKLEQDSGFAAQQITKIVANCQRQQVTN